MKLSIPVVFENLSRKFKFRYNLTRITGALHRHLCTFMTASLRIILRMRNVSDRFVEKIKTHNLWSITFFFSFENRAFCEIIVEKYSRPRKAINGNIIRRMRFTCWITMARIQTHTENS